MKMSKLALAIGALVMAGGAMAQSTATGTGTANASVILPITIGAGDTLEFGNVVSGVGTVVIATDGTRTESSGLPSSSAQKTTFRNATFNVAGEKGFSYSIALPGNVVLNNAVAGTMVASAFTVAAGGTGTVAGLVGTLDATSGLGVLKVGATLGVSANQPTGTYTNTYSVTVAYN